MMSLNQTSYDIQQLEHTARVRAAERRGPVAQELSTTTRGHTTAPRARWWSFGRVLSAVRRAAWRALPAVGRPPVVSPKERERQGLVARSLPDRAQKVL